MKWRDGVDPLIKNHLDKQVAESVRHRRDYEKAKNPGLAQLWIAVANLSKELFEMNLRIKGLESSLKIWKVKK